MGVAVGIDLGTTNTVVSAVKDGWPVTLTDAGNRRLLPSVVSFHPSGKVLVGHSARDRRIVDPTSTIFSVKRLIGRSWESPEVQRASKTMPFEIVEGDGHEAQVAARGERYTLPEISAFILRRAKAIAEAALGEPVHQAVITVPANFNDPQREATKLAGKLAGLDVLRILSEPTAAALAYGETAGKKERVAVYDLGGGTFDVTLLDVSGAVFQVLATGGDTALGGDDIDELIAGLMNDALLRQFRYDARTDPTARATLKMRAEELKILLSANPSADASLGNLVRGEGGQFLPASFKLERQVLETLASPLLERTLETCRRTVEKVGMSIEAIDRILLVGGSTRMPLVGRRVEEWFGRKVSARVNPDEVVAHGAAVQAAALARGVDVTGAGMRPRPSFSFAVSIGADVGPPAVSAPSAPASSPAAAVRESLSPAPPARVTVDASPASVPPSRSSLPPLSQDQEALLKAFLGADAPGPSSQRPSAAPAGPVSSRTSAAPPSRPAADVEAELRAFLGAGEGAPSPAPPPVAVPPAAVPEDLEAELRAFLTGAEPPSEPPPPLSAPDVSEAMIAVPELELPPPPRSAPGLPSSSSRPSPVISERPAAPKAPPLPPGRPPPRSPTLPVAAPVAGAPSRPPTPSGPPPPAMNPLLIDVTPLSLGVETVGGFCDMIIRANSPVPCDRDRVFQTASDGQTSVVVKICQGESDRFVENTTLGDLRLSGFRPAPRGEVAISVRFEIDADGILNVQAREVSTGRSASARIELLGAQTDAKKIEAMMDRQAQREVA